MAQLTSDIVWLVEQSVTLPDGTQQKALVPQLYAVVREGDVLASGALLSGAQVQLAADGTLNNTDTIAGRKLVQMEADTLNNLGGWVQGERVVMAAQQDINHIGGDIRAQTQLSLSAGRDLNVLSTTTSATNAVGEDRFSQSSLDRLAELSVSQTNGELLASAGRDLNLIAGIVQTQGKASLQAGNTLNLGTQTIGSSNSVAGGNAYLRDSTRREVGSEVRAEGALNLQAGANLNARAATVQAQGDLLITAGQDINLQAGQAENSFEFGIKSTTSGFLSSTTTSTRIQESSAQAQSSSVSGKNVDITAGRNLVSVGTQFSAAEQLQVQGGQTQAFYEALNVSQRQVDVQSSSSLLGLSLENKSSSDSRLQTTAVASRLVSSDKINVRVGERAILQGAQLQAQAIAFTATDPSRGAELVLGSSIETTQSSHTEKNETLGVWQAMQGQGSTVQTAKLTTLDGQVSFDAGLQVTVQTGSNANATGGGAVATLSGAANLQNQIDLLSAQPGLAYLKDLQANPKVNWEQVKLIHEQWSYSQQGLTPAGAALLSIAVAAYAPGLGNSTMTSLSSAVGAGGAAALNAGFIALQSQAAVALVNNGGDLGKTLAQLGSSESIQQLLTAMATAGAIQALNPGAVPTATGQSGAGAQAVSTVQAANDFLGNLQRNITNNLASAVIDSAISGKPLDASRLGQALTGALVTAGMAAGANAIGGANLDSFTAKLAHAALGCAGGAAMGGGGCSAGAAGAVAGELAADYYMDHQLDASKTFDQNVQSAKNFAKVIAAVSGVIAGGGGANVAAVNIASTTGSNAVENNYFSRSPFPKVRTAVAKENARLTAECGINCTPEDFRRIDQQAAKLERALNLVEVAQRGKLNPSDAVALTQLVMEIAPGTGTLESLAQLITGKQTLTGEETSRLWAAIGVIPFGGVLKPLGRSVGDLASVLGKNSDTIAQQAGNGANRAAQVNLLTRIAQDGHALERHGGGVTDQQLLTRALTGVAPDGSSVVRNGQTVIPPSSTAFHSDALLVQSDQLIRQNYLDRAIALSPPGAQRVTVEGVDMGINIGRGFDRVSSAPGSVGPLQFNSNLSRATAVYSYDAAARVWRTVTIYPVK